METQSSRSSEQVKLIRGLKKKLKQIQELKERSGSLDPQAQAKVDSERELLQELARLEGDGSVAQDTPVLPRQIAAEELEQAAYIPFGSCGTAGELDVEHGNSGPTRDLLQDPHEAERVAALAPLPADTAHTLNEDSIKKFRLLQKKLREIAKLRKSTVLDKKQQEKIDTEVSCIRELDKLRSQAMRSRLFFEEAAALLQTADAFGSSWCALLCASKHEWGLHHPLIDVCDQRARWERRDEERMGGYMTAFSAKHLQGKERVDVHLTGNAQHYSPHVDPERGFNCVYLGVALPEGSTTYQGIGGSFAHGWSMECDSGELHSFANGDGCKREQKAVRVAGSSGVRIAEKNALHTFDTMILKGGSLKAIVEKWRGMPPQPIQGTDPYYNAGLVNGDVVSIFYNEDRGELRFAVNGVMQPAYFVGVRKGVHVAISIANPTVTATLINDPPLVATVSPSKGEHGEEAFACTGMGGNVIATVARKDKPLILNDIRAAVSTAASVHCSLVQLVSADGRSLDAPGDLHVAELISSSQAA